MSQIPKLLLIALALAILSLIPSLLRGAEPEGSHNHGILRGHGEAPAVGEAAR